MPPRLLPAALATFLWFHADSLIATQLLGPEIPASFPEATEWPIGSRSNPHVASDGKSYLAVWTDTRSSAVNEIYATLLDAKGEATNRAGVRLARNGSTPHVVWNGRYYLVLFLRECSQILLTRVASDGQPIDSEPRPIASSYLCVQDLNLVSNGRETLLLVASPTGAQGVFLDSEGQPSHTVALANEYWYHPLVGTDGRDFVVVVAESRPFQRLRSIHVDAGGKQLGEAVIASVVVPPKPSLAWNGERYLMTLQGEKSISARFLDPSGSPATESMEIVPASPDGGRIADSELIWNGESFVLTYVVTHNLASALYGLAFTDPAMVAAPTRITDTAIGYLMTALGTTGGGAALMLWSFQYQRGHIVVAMFTSSSLRSSPVPRHRDLLGVTAREQIRADLIRINGGYAMAWLETFSATHREIRVSMLNDSGEPVPGTQRRLGITSDATGPRIGFDGSLLIVSWPVHSGFALVRMTTSFQVIDGNPVIVHFPSHSWRSGAELHVADGKLLLIWIEVDRKSVIYGQVVRTADLLPVGAEIRIAEVNELALGPAVGWNGREFLVVWSQQRFDYGKHPPLPYPPNKLFGARGSSQGALLDLSPIPIATGTRHRAGVSIASNGEEFMVVWAELAYRFDIYARRISGAGTLVDGFADSEAIRIANTAGSEQQPVVQHFGDGYVVLWITPVTASDYSVQLRRIGEDGSPRSGITALGVFEGGYSAQAARLAGFHDQVSVAYARVTLGDAGGVTRVFTRKILRFAPVRRRPAGMRDGEP